MNFRRKRSIDPVLLDRARQMRQESAPAEQKLWRCLRNRRLAGLRFRRQHPLAHFIADFYCHDHHLVVVELDGDSHYNPDAQSYDARRTQRLERDGYHVIRLRNPDIHKFLDAVLIEILREIERLHSIIPHPSPLPEGEGAAGSPTTPLRDPTLRSPFGRGRG